MMMSGTQTSSRCLTECAAATHNFEVTSYSLLNGMGVGNFVSSSTFSAGGCDWNIRFYADGCKDEGSSANHASAYLCFLKGPIGGVKVKCTLSLQGTDGKSHVQDSLTHTFWKEGFWGFDKFVRKMKLQQLSMDHDCFTIRCDLKVIKETRTEDVTAAVAVPPSSLREQFASMLTSGNGADVTFSVGDQSFGAHRCVLAARSPVFGAELFGEMKGTNATQTTTVQIHDMEPSIFAALLHYIYTDSLPDDDVGGGGDDNNNNTAMQHLLVAADRYGIDRLKAMCEGKLCENVDAQTVATTLALAEQHHCAQLKNACLGLLLSSQDVRRAVGETDGFRHLVTSCPLVLLGILDKVSPAPPQECGSGRVASPQSDAKRQRTSYGS